MHIRRGMGVMVLGGILLLHLSSTNASAQNRLGGHFGAVFPLVTHANGETPGLFTTLKLPATAWVYSSFWALLACFSFIWSSMLRWSLGSFP